MSEESLPPGWSKHWSNTWKKNYWFHAKSGKQSWEPPTGSEPESSSDSLQPAGTKRGPETVGKEPDSKQRKVETPQNDAESSSQESKPHGADSVEAAARGKQATSALPDSSKAKKSSPEKPAKVHGIVLDTMLLIHLFRFICRQNLLVATCWDLCWEA